MGGVSRVVALVITAALSVAGLAQARPASHVINAKVSIEQHGTTRDSRPPDGDVGDIFTTTLLMNNTAEAFGKPKGASVGSMLFRYVIHGTCSTETNHGLRFHAPESSTCSCKPRRPPCSRKT